MKVLVTGATGGIGELVIAELLKRNCEIIATARDLEKAKNCPFFHQITFIPFDLSETHATNLFDFFKKPDALIHLAWDKLNDYKNQEHLTKILPQHESFLANLIEHGLQNVTVVGTVYEYGLREGELSEEMPSEAIMPYPQAKNQLRVFLEALKSRFAVSLKWPRIFYVFGAIKGRRNLYTALESAVKNKEEVFNMSGGEQIRDFLSPQQIAEYIVAIALQSEVEGVINCCSGKPITVKDQVNNYFEAGRHYPKINYGFYPYPDYEPMNSWGSTLKLKQVLNVK